MRSLQTVPIVLLELIACAIQAIEAHPNARFLRRQDTKGNTTLALPVVAEPSQFWEGVDGIWSTFSIRVGTPASVFRILPATSWQETWVVYGSAAGVCNATLGVAADCQEDRGGSFDVSKSASWKIEQQRPLDLNSNLGKEGVGQYGFDNVGLGYSNTSGPLLRNQIVAAMVSDDYWFGSLGLGFQPTNFTGYDNPQPSFAESLFAQGRISSRSWSYTAGAYYRLKSVFGNLVFGGYDASRFRHNNVSFTMAGDNMRDLVVTLRSISVGGNKLMDTPEFAFIDSSLAELWLPSTVCDAFERDLGLQIDEASGYYLLNETTHSALVRRKPEFTFTLANQKEGHVNETVEIILPYAAFDMNISAPLLPNRTEYYFPIRRAPRNQYILGRTFLQEAYVTAHYGDRVFNVSQCVFEERTGSQLVALPEKLSFDKASTTPSLPTSPGNKKNLSGGAIAGIVIGTIASLVLVALFIFLCRQRRSRNHPEAVEIDTGRRIENSSTAGKWTSEHGEQTSSFTNEVEGRERVELDGAPFMHPAELAAEQPLSALDKETGVSSTNRAEKIEEAGLSDDKDFAEHEPASPTSPTSLSEKELEERLDVLGMGMESDKKMKRKPSLSGSLSTSTVAPSLDGEWQGWTPSSPVQRSGTAGSRFREGF